MLEEKDFGEIDIVIMLSTYNGEMYLDKQLQSIYEQTYEGKILLYTRDDGSTDGTLAIFHKWENEIDILRVEDNERLGAAQSFWKLFMSAPKAKYYAFVDQDDIWHKDKIRTAISVLEGKEEMALWFSNCNVIDARDMVIADYMNDKKPILTVSSQMVCGIAQGCAMVFNYKLVEYCTSSDIKYVPMHDTVIFSYALAAGEVIYEERAYFSYRVHSNNVVAKQGKNFWGKAKSIYRVWIKHRKEVSRLAEEVLRNNSKFLLDEEKEFLEALSKAPVSFKSRWKVIKNPRAKTINRKGLRTFRLRTILGII